MNFIDKIWKSKLWLLITVGAIVLVNWLASVYHTRVDLTNEKRFTLSSSTKKILKQLDDVVEIKIFLKGTTNSGFTKLAKSTEELLHEFKEVTGSNFRYKFIDPDDIVDGSSVTYADTLLSMGVAPLIVNAQIKSGEQQLRIFPVAMLNYADKINLVSLYEGNSVDLKASEINSAEAMLEYTFIRAIAQFKRNIKPIIAYSVGNGEAVGPETFDMQGLLQYNDTLFTLNLNKVKFISDTFKVLMIVKPTIPFTDDEKLKIDQYVMRGGKLLMFIDKLNAEVDSITANSQIVAYDRELGLNDILFKYGVRINSDLVMDLQCDRYPIDLNNNGQYALLKWNYFPLFQTKPTHVINKNLGIVSGRFVNSIDTVEADGIKKTVILSSSVNARKISTPALITVDENRQEPVNDKFKTANIPVAVLLEGKFSSMFKNRLSQAMTDSLENYGQLFQSQGINDNKIIVVSDGDIILNNFYEQKPLPMGVNPYSMIKDKQVFPVANSSFLENCIEYLINENGMMDAKAKDYTLRFLDPVKIEEEKTFWQLLNIAAPILIVILFAFIFQWVRKRKYRV